MMQLVIISLHIGGGRRLEIFDPADRRPVIGVLSKSGRPHFVFERLPWTVESDMQLFFYDFLLGIELLLGEGGGAHAIRLYLARVLPAIRRKGELVGGVVLPGEAVIRTAVLEHHVIAVAPLVR